MVGPRTSFKQSYNSTYRCYNTTPLIGGYKPSYPFLKPFTRVSIPFVTIVRANLEEIVQAFLGGKSLLNHVE